ncbi:GIY-YIG nuclease family protein [Patescibacteria group bacterium]|nr:GIY-YIG nuclease family protein [Patescibacteria group bacterium]MBU4142406.1 GIY-YIG nuclease family protein [Patescibacteria group bacterium]
MHYVYVLKDKKDIFYIGYTNNLQRRFLEHQREDKNSWTLIYYEAYIIEKLARDRERKLKYYGSAWRALKKRLIA